jgi:hypothetical protein
VFSLHSFGAGELGDSFGAFGHGVLGELSGEDQTDGRLNLARGDRGALVVVGETRGLGSDPLEDVVHERVHDRHRLGRDAGVRVHLLQHAVDVDGVGLLPRASALLVTAFDGLDLLHSFLSSFARWFRWCHFALNSLEMKEFG